MNSKKIGIILFVLVVLIIIIFMTTNKQTSEAPAVTDNTSPAPAEQSDQGELSFIESLTNIGTDISFVHVVPGEYSEVYLLIRGGTPGETKLVTLEGPGMVSDNDQMATFDENGEARYTWRINRYGEYSAYEDHYNPVTEEDEPEFIRSVVVN
ncbi:MAG: hypothetical protein KC877_03535 [Candidatus Kaiserbacteria bacterium]|nr:hypothetical protein [Candidatus Kaiserbacteria bacterium]MCB9812753.1 hypothetical protein [Candidatus Nomurabacteria bacterium]MCB9816408.1 hypothetical protein [Candidatus Nomurabacteria bacterium]